ncbi:MAG: hypothetical protein V4576_02585 [Patescibacteria group bacterium]
MPLIYHTTSVNETLESHVYIRSYKDPEIKGAMHAYKFNGDTNAKQRFILYILDLCIILGNCIYTSPPSTMHARGEKKVDSMFELLKSAVRILRQYTQGSAHAAQSIFSISSKYLKHKKAQHIGGTRKIRTADIDKRYTVRTAYKIKLWMSIHIRKQRHFSYVILDDVSSTGATLIACRNTLSTYMSMIQRKNPDISYNIQIFSILH